MSKKERIVAWVFRQNFNEGNFDDYSKKDRQNAIYVWIISFVLFFASLFFMVGTRSLFGQTVVDYTSTGTWTCPAGVTTVLVECWGGGGAGGGATGNPSAGGGGAGGSYSRKIVTVVPTTNYTVTVATAVGGTTGAGATGNPSWFGDVSTIYAQGGQGGGLASSNSTNGTAGAGSTTLCIGDIVYAGGNGSDGIFTSGTPCGAGGGGAGSDGVGGNASAGTGGTGNSFNGGNGANGVADSSPGTSGSNYGGGGSGGKANGPQDRAGGAGAPGFVRITYGYCRPAPTAVDDLGITNVTFGTVNNSTGTETNNYGDYSAQSASFSQGETVPVSITYQTGYTYDTKIWIDWNNDWDFDDAGE
ncbi:MAG: hypothetical protein PHE56_01280, partial [Bacteroidales bacterium]|nr:hypothetical protein [Bacteroidales bacterium]